MFTRREFLQASLKTSTLVALAPTVPVFLAQTARAASSACDSRILVVIQLDGGNDGINTVVPFADPGYAKHRKALRLPVNRLHKITSEMGLHPQMTAIAKLMEDGRFAIVQGVGYPNPSRSHAKSMAIWHTGNVLLPRTDDYDPESKAAFGWIGQTLDQSTQPNSPDAVFVGAGPLPSALRGRRSVASAISCPEDSVLALQGATHLAQSPQPRPLSRRERGECADLKPPSADDLAAFVEHSTLDAYAASDRMVAVLRAEDKGAVYPATALAGRLRVIARLIKGGGGTRVYYTDHGSYDTHATQLDHHADLLAEFSGAMKAFLDDLAEAKLAERVLILCFSEFGRRVDENASLGTDHGTAGPVFIAGPSVRAGLIGEAPKLLDLEAGDLKTTTDFRQVYATVVEEWLGLAFPATLNGTLAKLALLRT
jgi:uncharacterized protein (DUF1501 family)